MNTTKRNCDPFGRARVIRASVLHAVALTLVITGSAWPSWARSDRPSVDKSPRDNSERRSGASQRKGETLAVRTSPAFETRGGQKHAAVLARRSPWRSAPNSNIAGVLDPAPEKPHPVRVGLTIEAFSSERQKQHTKTVSRYRRRVAPNASKDARRKNPARRAERRPSSQKAGVRLLQRPVRRLSPGVDQ